MNNGPSRTNANKNSIVGAAKENIGSTFGNHSLESKGAAQRAEGNAEHRAARTRSYGEGAKDSMKGNVKDTVGSVTGNRQMQAEGQASRLHGNAKKEINA